MAVKEEYFDVVVVGAGLAGLSCAAELRRSTTWKVALLEARQRIGGRVHTIDQSGATPAWPCPIEMGGQWAHSFKPHHPLARLAKEAGVALKMHSWDDATYLSAGMGHKGARVIPEAEVDQAWVATEKVFRKAMRKRGQKSGTPGG